MGRRADLGDRRNAGYGRRGILLPRHGGGHRRPAPEPLAAVRRQRAERRARGAGAGLAGAAGRCAPAPDHALLLAGRQRGARPRTRLRGHAGQRRGVRRAAGPPAGRHRRPAARRAHRAGRRVGSRDGKSRQGAADGAARSGRPVGRAAGGQRRGAEPARRRPGPQPRAARRAEHEADACTRIPARGDPLAPPRPRQPPLRRHPGDSRGVRVRGRPARDRPRAAAAEPGHARLGPAPAGDARHPAGRGPPASRRALPCRPCVRSTSIHSSRGCWT